MGLLRFDKFMEHALHHPSQGYYAKTINNVGKEGDFSTAATLSDGLAEAIARWIQDEAKFHQWKRLNLIEMGAGNGQLARDIKKYLPYRLNRKISLNLVETSRPLVALQKENIGLNARWFQDPEDALKECQGKALIYSNELVDAFPVRVFESCNQGFKELYIDTESRAEVMQSTSDFPESSFFSQELPTGTRFEVHQSFHIWLQGWIGHLESGSILSVDYGDEVEDQIRFSPKGSLRGYFKHHLIKGAALYRNVGHQDITCDVNFTDLICWGNALGLKYHSLLTQQEFINRNNSKVDHFLCLKDGAGSAFKVLQQRKMIPL